MDRGRRTIGVTLIVLVLMSMGSRSANAEPLPSAIVSRDADTIAHGKRLFAQSCSPCHGQQGVGENPATPMGGWNPQVGPVAPALDFGLPAAMIRPSSCCRSWATPPCFARRPTGWASWCPMSSVWSSPTGA